jgi:hypothetical protein
VVVEVEDFTDSMVLAVQEVDGSANTGSSGGSGILQYCPSQGNDGGKWLLLVGITYAGGGGGGAGAVGENGTIH